jgi:hypothetical protein
MNRLRALLPLALTLAVSCGGDNTGPNPIERVAGTYHATRIDLTFAGSDDVVDAIALGASIDVVLSLQSTTTGALVIPAVLAEDGDEDVIDLEGTFTATDSTLHFQPVNDSFFGEPTWTIGNGTLTAFDSQAQGTLAVTLTRSEPIEGNPAK